MEQIETLLLRLAELIGAGAVVFGTIFALYRWVFKQGERGKQLKLLEDEIQNEKKQHDGKIDELRHEQAIICYGVLAALKGLKEQGCNGPVTEAIQTLEKHLNVQAHR